MILYNILFYIFSFLMVVAACGVIFSRNGVHSVLFLIFAFFNAAALFVMLGAEFLAAALVIVYVGAIAVLFLFVIMMLNLETSSLKSVFNRHFKFIMSFGALLFFELLLILYMSDKVKPHAAASSTPIDHSQLTNTKQLGMVLYTNYLLAFELAGIILFVAMVSAIVLTHRKRKAVRKQVVSEQLQRNKKNSIKLVQTIKVGDGVSPIRK